MKTMTLSAALTAFVENTAYSTDLKKLEATLRGALPALRTQHPDLYLSDVRYKGVELLGESGIDLKFTVDTTEELFFDAQRMLARDIKILFDEKGVEIPFPQVVVHQGE